MAGRVLVLLLVAACTAQAAVAGVRLECPDTVPEGEPFVVTVVADEPLISVTVHWLGREVRPLALYRDGAVSAKVLLGMGMHERQKETAPVLQVVAETPGGPVRLKRTISRTAKAYKEQHLDVARKYTSLSDVNLKRHRAEQVRVREAFRLTTTMARYDLPLLRPVPGKITSQFGLRRFFNGEARKPHSGVDLNAAQGDLVMACADGRVIMAEDHFFAGNSIYLDHGQGVVSMYFHLSGMDVAQGDEVRRGQVIGRIGSTGRVTGPHLHWGLSVLGQLVDPLILAE